jgi:Kef-type K+ transport system membrane component KefB
VHALISNLADPAALTDALLTLAAILIGAKLLGEVAERIGQPAVVGELAAGVLLGTSVFGIVDPNEPIIAVLAEIGVIILLFQIGLETDLKKLAKVGGSSFLVAVVGVVLPFGLGLFVARLFGLSILQQLVIGAALTATSVGITARVLSDLGRLQDEEGQIVLGAAVLDDVLGLIILAVVGQLVAGERVTVFGAGRITLIAFGFLILALVVGRLLLPPLFVLLKRLGRADTLAIGALAIAFLFSVAAETAGSALILGAFAAGLALNSAADRRHIEAGVVRLGHFFVPVFFVTVAAAVDVRALASGRVLLIGSCLTVAGIVGKVLAGYAPWRFSGRKIVVGVAMIPRGEVGLIFAQMGLVTGVLTPALFSAIMLMVLATTFVAPPWLRYLLAPRPGQSGDSSGVAELTCESG